MKTQKINKAVFMQEVCDKLLTGEPVTNAELKIYAKFVEQVNRPEINKVVKAGEEYYERSKSKSQKAKTKTAKSQKAKTKTVKDPEEIYFENLSANGFEQNEVLITEYSKKAFAIFGDTKPVASILASAGAKLNRFLTHANKRQAGWIISKKLIDKKGLKQLIS